MKSKMSWFAILGLFLAFASDVSHAGGGGGSRYVNTGSYSGPPRKNVSVYEPLLDSIFEGYNPLAIPICKQGKPLHLMIDMWLYQLFDLNEPKQELTIDVWIDLNWKDCSISWDPAKYNGINQFTLPSHDVWFPDIFAYQGLHGNYEEGLFVFRESKVKIKHDGMVQMGAQLLLRTFCRVDILKFPYDQQECPITFSAWNKDMTVFNMTKKPRHDSAKESHAFTKASNGEWTVLGLTASNGFRTFHVGAKEDTLENFSEVTFKLGLRRKPLFVHTYLVFPCMLMLWLASVSFLLPVSCGEKVGLVSTVLLALVVFLLVIADNVPHTSDSIPYVARFFFACIALVTLALVLTTIVLNVSHKSPIINMPRCLRKFSHSTVASFFCFTPSMPSSVPTSPSVQFRVGSAGKKTNDNGGGGKGKSSNDPCAEINAQSLSEYHHERIAANCWSELGRLFDRIFLFVYLILCVMTSMYMLTAGLF